MRRQLLEAYVGLQWGDEGKGKLVDEAVHRARQLADGRRTVVVRYQGGANAGHSVYVRKGDELVKFVTHAAPTGLTNNADIAIGPQVAFNPLAFADELEGARALFGYDGRVLVSERTGVLMDYHKILDACWEKKAGGGVGTTKQGIGPFYVDNARRTTRITFADYVSEGFADTLGRVLRLKEPELRDAEPEFEAAGIKRSGLLDMLVAKHDVVRRALRPFATNLEENMYNHVTGGHHMIIEGGQGSGLDVDMGTIPDQTSSHLLAPHAFPSLGISRSGFKIYGVEKVYPTRVGNGDMPTLAGDEFGEEIARNAGEFGATTRRPRRVGYPDLVFVRRSARLNDCDGIMLTRIDNVQDKDMKVCLEYQLPHGEQTHAVPLNLKDVTPVYRNRTFKWHLWDGPQNLSDPQSVDAQLKPFRDQYVENGFQGLPRGLLEFIELHDAFVKCPTVAISIGPGRGETIWRC